MEKNNSKMGPVKIAMVNHFRSRGWYSWQLAKELAKIIPRDGSLYLYGPRSSKGLISPFANFRAVWSSALYPLQIVVQALKDRVNIVHLQFEFVTFGSPYTSVLVIPLLILLKLVRVKTVITIHGPAFPKGTANYLFESLSPSSPLPPYLLRAYCVLTYRIMEKMAAATIVHANIFQKWLNGQGVRHIQVIPHGVEVVNDDSTNGDGDDKTILCFGVVSPRKGLENLLLAFSEISRELPGYKLIIAGGEPSYYKGYLNTLKAQAIKPSQIFKIMSIYFLAW